MFNKKRFQTIINNNQNAIIIIAIAVVLILMTAISLFAESVIKQERLDKLENEKQEQLAHEKEVETAEKKADSSIEEARGYIRGKDYNAAIDALGLIDKNTLTNEYRTKERKSLCSYAKLLLTWGKDQDYSLNKQSNLADDILFDDTDEFYSDAKTMKKIIRAKLDLISFEGKLQAAGKERKRREKIAKGIPYKGMDEKDISSTSAGSYTAKNINLVWVVWDGIDEDFDTLYEWIIGSDSQTIPLEVGTEDGTVTYVNQDYELWAWDGNKPLFVEEVVDSKELHKGKKDKYNVYSYNTAMDFANDNQKLFASGIEAEYSQKMKAASSEKAKKDVSNLAWIEAFDYWLDKQKYRTIDQEAEEEAFQEAVANSQN